MAVTNPMVIDLPERGVNIEMAIYATGKKARERKVCRWRGRME